MSSITKIPGLASAPSVEGYGVSQIGKSRYYLSISQSVSQLVSLSLCR